MTSDKLEFVEVAKMKLNKIAARWPAEAVV